MQAHLERPQTRPRPQAGLVQLVAAGPSTTREVAEERDCCIELAQQGPWGLWEREEVQEEVQEAAEQRWML